MFFALTSLYQVHGGLKQTNDRGRDGPKATPPSKPDRRFSRIRLSGQWALVALAACTRAKAKEISPRIAK